MIVTCPACTTRYLIDPRALGMTGRSVRCTQCSHTWMQLPPEDAPRRVDLPAPGAAARPSSARFAPQQSAPVAPPATALPPFPDASSPAEAGPDQIPAGVAVAAPHLARGGNRPLVIALIAILVLGALWYGHATIVERIPALESIYGALGIASSGVTSARDRA